MLSFVVGVGCLVGCSQPEPAVEPSTATVSEVPLRILYVGQPEEAKIIERSWSLISDQVLAFTVVPPENAVEDLVKQAGRHDVIVYFSSDTGRLVDVQAIRRLRSSLFSPTGDSDGARIDFFPALEFGAMRLGDEAYGVPLGAMQPILVHPPALAESKTAESKPDEPSRWTWESYGRQIKNLEPGKAAEPLADGWAAQALLARANGYSDSSWMFMGELTPALATAPYLRALKELAAAAESYPEERLTPEQVWEGVQKGRFDVAITWITNAEPLEQTVDVVLDRLPTTSEVYESSKGEWSPREVDSRSEWVLLGPYTRVGAIASGCRQTSLSERFLTWLAAGEGTAEIRRSIPSFTVTARNSNDLAGGAGRLSGEGAEYESLLVTELQNTYVRPGFRLPGSQQYWEALDREVIAVLEKKKSPEEALVDASRAWDEISESLDISLQKKAWRAVLRSSR
ncbi:hypothetical protein FF011L_20390 [Roseimaritima multifibrata]|uniref:Bacterial extracellular solute-binding protein n=1 Tax=Roseimaritima multifibrata TaxID=1930274 RepID=A0A517MET0_9BACT|nr:hypothetical protein [Roseimaritima multifibrata]QDS93277.1 hypothetical protein FF011L_20390 [Roseimaritima multifibrata]